MDVFNWFLGFNDKENYAHNGAKNREHDVDLMLQCSLKIYGCFSCICTKTKRKKSHCI